MPGSKVRSLDETYSADRVGWKVEAGCCTAAFRQDVASAVYCDVVDHESRTGSSATRLVDCTAKGYAGMRQIDQTGDFPGRRVTRGGDVHPRGQRRILI